MNQVLRSPARAFSPVELREVLSSGLMSFPLTDFDKAGDFHEQGYRDRLEWLMPYGATVLFAAGGTGEVFSMTPAEQARVTQVAVETCGSDTPIIAGAGYGTRLAIEMAQAAEKAGRGGDPADAALPDRGEPEGAGGAYRGGLQGDHGSASSSTTATSASSRPRRWRGWPSGTRT